MSSFVPLDAQPKLGNVTFQFYKLSAVSPVHHLTPFIAAATSHKYRRRNYQICCLEGVPNHLKEAVEHHQFHSQADVLSITYPLHWSEYSQSFSIARMNDTPLSSRRTSTYLIEARPDIYNHSQEPMTMFTTRSNIPM